MATLLKISIALSVLLVAGVVGLLVALPSTQAGPAPPRYPYWMLERDRVMTEHMRTDTGAGMHMDGESMWSRLDDPGYMRALEWHMQEIDRMLGRSGP